MKRCELCGTPVKVVGHTTKHYEPITTKSEPVKITESEIISIVNNAYYGMGNGTYDIKELSFRIAQAIHNALYGCGE